MTTDALTLTAPAPAAAVFPSVRLGELMSALTARFDGVLCGQRDSRERVDFVRHDTHMRDVDAGVVAAKMVDDEAIRDRAPLHHPRNAMCELNPPLKQHMAVAGVDLRADPLDAAVDTSGAMRIEPLRSSARIGGASRPPTLVVECAKSATVECGIAISNRTGTMGMHREPILSGVMRAEATTSRPLYCTAKMAAPEGGQ